jgi:hypothetical protein
VSLPLKIGFRDFMRYLAPGVLTLYLYYPYINCLVPFWSQLTSDTLRIAAMILFILVAGIVVEGFTRVFSEKFINKLYKRVGGLLGLDINKEEFMPKKRFEEMTWKQFKIGLYVNASHEEKEILYNTSSVAFMAGGFALILFTYFVALLISAFGLLPGINPIITCITTTQFPSPIVAPLLLVLTLSIVLLLSYIFLRVAWVQYAYLLLCFDAVSQAIHRREDLITSKVTKEEKQRPEESQAPTTQQNEVKKSQKKGQHTKKT